MFEEAELVRAQRWVDELSERVRGSRTRGAGSPAMKLVQTLVVRDEADIVDAQIAYHLNAGVDFVIATDHESVDGTTDILESYARDGLPAPDPRARREPARRAGARGWHGSPRRSTAPTG